MKTFSLAAVPLGAALSLALAAPGAFATTAVSGNMSLTAHATVDGGSDVSTPSTDSWAATPAALSVSAAASATDGVLTNTSSGSASATWASADSGTVTFTDYGWDRHAAGETDLTTGGADWSYTFVADQSGTFTFDYTVTGSGETFGLWGWAIGLTDSAGLPVSDPGDPTTSGSFSGSLVAGNTYTATLENNANISTQQAADIAGSMNGEFDWAITSTSAVPEPGNLALMLAGLAAIGALRRRAKR